MRDERMEDPSVRRSTFSSVSIFPLPRRGERVHTRAHTRVGLTIMATDQRPSLNIRKPNRWFNPTMDRSFGQYSGQMYYRRQTVNGGGGCKIGAEWTPYVRSVCLCPRWKRGWLNETRPFIFLSHFLSRMRSLRFDSSMPLSSSGNLLDSESGSIRGEKERRYEWYMSRDRMGIRSERCGPFSCFGASSRFAYAFVIVSVLFREMILRFKS